MRERKTKRGRQKVNKDNTQADGITMRQRIKAKTYKMSHREIGMETQDK